MKINHKLFLSVLSIIIPAFFIILFLAHNLYASIESKRELEEYKNYKEMIREILVLQDNKLQLISSAINNDSLFLHSIFLFEELGYNEQVSKILDVYAKQNNIDAYEYISSKGTSLGNLEYKLSESGIDALCKTNKSQKRLVENEKHRIPSI